MDTRIGQGIIMNLRQALLNVRTCATKFRRWVRSLFTRIRDFVPQSRSRRPKDTRSK
jgi:hypothetical protein